MRESRTYGSVRGALSNERPYRDRFARNDRGYARNCPSAMRYTETPRESGMP